MGFKKLLCTIAGTFLSALAMSLVVPVTAKAAVSINETTFPDPIFRSVISGSDYDRDGNGILDDTEIALTINIYCEGMGISSIQGVEYFTALQGLWCKDNYISYMDVSNNKDLHGVWCSGNLFTSLDFSGNPELEWVYCYDCNLTSLNISNNPKMSYLEVNTNPLTVLDVSHNPLLEHLTCGSCELTSLNLGNNPNLTHLDAFRNHLTSLDVSGCPKLKRLDIWDNAGLGSINVSQNPGLQYYNCANNDALTIDVTHNPELVKLICSYNDISGIDLTHNPKLVYLDCACNNLTSLNLSGNPQLYFLQAFTNPFTTLDIGSNPLLIQTYQTGVKKNESSVGQCHSWTLDYGGDTSTGGDNIYFLCFDDKVSLAAVPTAGSDVAVNGPNIPYDPNLVTREMVLQTLYIREGFPNVTGLTTRFTDVAQGSWYENAIIWGEKNSIAFGTPYISSSTFGVGQPVTRQDLLLMLMRYSEYRGYKRSVDFGRADDYLDYYDVDYYAWEAVTWSATWQIMDGIGEPGAPKTEQRIDPHGTVTRVDFLLILNRLLEVNGEANSNMIIPEEAGVPEGGTGAQGTDTQGTDTANTDATSTNSETDASNNQTSQAEVTAGNNTETVSDISSNASTTSDSVSTQNDKATNPFLLILLIGLIIAAVITALIMLRKRGGH